MKKALLTILALTAALALTACAGAGANGSGTTAAPAATVSLTAESPATQAPESAAGSETAAASTDDTVFRISGPAGGVSESGNVYTVTAAGTYVLTGTLTEGRIVVAAGESDEVVLELSGVSLTSASDSPIRVNSADKVKIKAAEGTVNTVTDARPLKTAESDTAGEAAIYALCDLDLSGKGTLTVTASYHNGIQTKDDLSVKNLTLSVTAPNTALKGNDSVTVESGAVTAVSTAGDGVKTDNSDLSAKENQRGTVTVSGGTVTIYAACDGIDAAYNVEISGDPTLTVATHAYSSYTAATAKKTTVSSGVTKSAESAKGIKAGNAVTISGGTVTILSMDDGIHANGGEKLGNGAVALGNVTVSGGSVGITAADDGVHADGALLIEDGSLDVTESHEGMEGHTVTVNGGEIRVYATDDGVNAAASSGGKSDGLITVNGGKLTVEVAGRDVDGIDANGSYRQTGGFVVVSNPNADASGNMSAVDADGTVTVTGGVIVALGTVPGTQRGGGRFGIGGMNAGSSLPSGYVTFSGTLAAGEHTFTFGDTSETFSLKSPVTGGWIWASGVTADGYTLK